MGSCCSTTPNQAEIDSKPKPLDAVIIYTYLKSCGIVIDDKEKPAFEKSAIKIQS